MDLEESTGISISQHEKTSPSPAGTEGPSPDNGHQANVMRRWQRTQSKRKLAGGNRLDPGDGGDGMDPKRTGKLQTTAEGLMILMILSGPTNLRSNLWDSTVRGRSLDDINTLCPTW